MEKTAIFRNWTSEDFIGYWDGKKKLYKAGSEIMMDAGKAAVLARHLTNRELIRTKPDGTLEIPGGDKATSPKKPEENLLYKNLFDKAYIPEENEESMDETDVENKILNTNRSITNNLESMVVNAPVADDEDEESFKGKPKE